MINYFNYSDEFLMSIYSYNNIIVDDLYGSVLYLGMGSMLFPRKQQNVTKTTIVEKYKEIIDENIKRNNIKEDYIIINEDAFTYLTDEKFDIIFVDCFDHKSDKINFIIEKYKNNLKEEGKIIYLKTITTNE